ncbi:MAG TPA: HdeD family acid-resistance protein [Stellaceae bacterium]|nr:HdeD family acid-resistance protein [Stellaceae bacterium]
MATEINVRSVSGTLGASTLSDDMSALLARNWWVIGLRGLFAIVFGAIAVLMPGVTLAALVLLFAAYMLVDGVLAIVAALRAARQHERWGLLILEGVADLIAGGIAVFWPLITIVALIYLTAAWAIVSGSLLLAASFRLNVAHGRWLMFFGGAASMVWGILLIAWPLAGALVLVWWLAAYALFFGGALLVLAFQLRRRRPAGKLQASATNA